MKVLDALLTLLDRSSMTELQLMVLAEVVCAVAVVGGAVTALLVLL